MFDETIAWSLGATSSTGTFKLINSAAQILPLHTNGIKTTGKLYVDTGSDVISVTNTTNYEEGIFTYTGSNIVDGGGGVVQDDDNIPNTKAVVDYVTYALTTLGTSDNIAEGDTKVEVQDFSVTGAPSKMLVNIDGTERFAVYDNRLEFASIRLSGNTISVLDSNADLKLEAAGTGSVVVNDILNLMETPGVDDASVDPSAPTEGVKLYSKTQGSGSTGLFFVNKSSTSDEIISQNRALVYSMIF